VRGTAITASEVQIAVDVNLQKVSVRIDRDSIPLWFARLVGRQVASVNAHAAARAAEAGGATCVLPFAVPDIWDEPPASSGGDDLDDNDIMDTNENWIFGDDTGESYVPYINGSPTETGYGSDHRNGQSGSSPVTFPVNGDYGRKMILKVQRPRDALVSGFFYPFNHPGNNGGSDYRDAISSCDPAVISLGVPIDILPGDKVGPTRQGMADLIDLDSGATWDENTNQLVSQYGFNSPRVRIVPLYDPNWIAAVCGGPNGNCTGAGTLELEFNNFAVLFVEDFNQFDDTVVGRFMYYAQGTGGAGPGGTTGSLVRILQLVE
jgi:hypothetical protein